DVQRRVPHHATGAESLPSDLELWLDHEQQVGVGGGDPGEGGQDERERDEGEVADDEVDRRGDLGRVEGADVGAFQDAHARVVAKSPGQLSVPDVHGEDVRGSAAEQHVGEAAGGGTGVQAAPAGDDRRLRAEC